MMVSILEKYESDNERYGRKPEPITARSNRHEIVGTQMRYNQIDYGRPEEMCEVEIHALFLNYLSSEHVNIARSEKENNGTIWIFFIIFSDQPCCILESVSILNFEF